MSNLLKLLLNNVMAPSLTCICTFYELVLCFSPQLGPEAAAWFQLCCTLTQESQAKVPTKEYILYSLYQLINRILATPKITRCFYHLHIMRYHVFILKCLKFSGKCSKSLLMKIYKQVATTVQITHNFIGLKFFSNVDPKSNPSDTGLHNIMVGANNKILTS